jgi:hypothetical protein
VADLCSLPLFQVFYTVQPSHYRRSYEDNLEKYIRIGRTPLTLGAFMDGPDGGFQNGKFPGLQSKNNYAALMEAIGFSSSVAFPKKLHMLVVTKNPQPGRGHSLAAPPPRPGSGVQYVPTWTSVVKYYQYWIQTVVARGQAPYRSFTFDPSVSVTCGKELLAYAISFKAKKM